MQAFQHAPAGAPPGYAPAAGYAPAPAPAVAPPPGYAAPPHQAVSALPPGWEEKRDATGAYAKPQTPPKRQG